MAAQPASVTNKTKTSPSVVSTIQEVVPSHVVLTVEAVQPITTHVSGKKQAAVKAIPRAKLKGEDLVMNNMSRLVAVLHLYQCLSYDNTVTV